MQDLQLYVEVISYQYKICDQNGIETFEKDSKVSIQVMAFTVSTYVAYN